MFDIFSWIIYGSFSCFGDIFVFEPAIADRNFRCSEGTITKHSQLLQKIGWRDSPCKSIDIAK